MSNWLSDLLFWIIFGAILYSLRRQRIFWTVGALALLLLFNQFFTPGFFHIQLLEGHFYGSRIDVLNQGAKVMLLSLGMVLVIATGGVDLVPEGLEHCGAQVFAASHGGRCGDEGVEVVFGWSGNVRCGRLVVRHFRGSAQRGDIPGGEVAPESEDGGKGCADFAKSEVQEAVTGCAGEGFLEAALQILR